MNTLACVKGVLKGASALTDTQLDEIIADFRTKKRQAMREAGGTHAEGTLAAQIAERNATRLRIEAARQRLNAGNNAIKQRQMLDQRSLYATPDNPNGNIAYWAEAMARPSNRDVPGARESATAKQEGYIGKNTSGFVYDLEKAGMINYVATRLRDVINPLKWGKLPLENKIVLEAFELSLPNGKPGTTGSPEALTIAKIIHKWQEVARGDLNRLGASIGKVPGWIMSQTHDMVRISRAGFPKWRAQAERTYGNERTYESIRFTGDAAKDAALVTEFWQQGYNQLSQGEFFRIGDESGFKGPGNLAKKVSQHRTYHPNSGELLIEYNDQFGAASLMEGVLGGLVSSGKAAGLMEKFGTNPKAQFLSMIEAARQHDLKRGLPIDERLRQGGFTSRLWDVIDGTADIPARITVAKIGALIRSHQSVTKLGASVIASLTDIPVSADLIRNDFGDNIFAAALKQIQMRFGQVADKGRQREMALLTHVGVDTFVRDLSSRVTSADAINFKAAQKTLSAFFKLNAQNKWTDSGDTALGAYYNARMGLLRDTKYADLPDNLNNILGRHSIGEKEWDVIRQYARHDYDADTPMLVSDKLRDMPPAAIDPLVEWPLEALRIESARGLERMQTRLRGLDKKVETLTEQIGSQGESGLSVAAMRGARDEMGKLLADDLAAKRWSLMQQDASPDAVFRGAADLAKEHERLLNQYREQVTQAIRDLRAAQKAEPAVLDKLGEAIVALREASDAVAAWPASLERQITQRRELAIQELESKLNTFYSDRVHAGIIRGTATEKTYATRGAQPGTPEGEGLRFIMQFKQYPMAFVQQVLGRHAQEDRFWRIPGALAGRMYHDPRGTGAKVASLTAMLWVTGYLAMALKDIAKGREPRDPRNLNTIGAAFVQSGGGGIFGDYLFARVNRFGGSLSDAAMGPALGEIFEGGDIVLQSRDAIFSDLVGDGDDQYPDVRAMQWFTNQSPAVNLFYTSAALKYLMFYDIQEWLRPGSLRRMERNLKNKQGQEFILPPSQNRVRPFTGH